ncbi:MAG: FKBP-type peptidyl-prolyl cis-trans isomerase [Ginsengibacter sp.]
MKKVCIILSMIAIGTAHAQTKKTAVKKPVVAIASANVFKNSEDSLSYALGLEGASFYKNQGFTKVNSKMVAKAFDDVFGNKKILLTPEQSNMSIQRKMQEYMSNKSKVEKDKGAAFLAANKKRPGVVVLPNGLQYEIITAGTGAIPKVTDTVTAHYIGGLIDGKEFDNSYKRGQPLEIPVSGVIQGWVQALQMMPVGSKWKLYIPSDLGYGDRGAGNGGIPGGATLVFTVELLSIVHK